MKAGNARNTSGVRYSKPLVKFSTVEKMAEVVFRRFTGYPSKLTITKRHVPLRLTGRGLV
ncbi:hypothetical protein EYF80_064210 [Liparis tanakae]|uniref:Uncharacterized protein n=1 Tax=Liparis tanakae TaxID=230148 RepID=A0A4Z2EA24_9TELE|nr:hypothetical protein EYF80_064210 [Liparis tanakae]